MNEPDTHVFGYEYSSPNNLQNRSPALDSVFTTIALLLSDHDNFLNTHDIAEDRRKENAELERMITNLRSGRASSSIQALLLDLTRLVAWIDEDPHNRQPQVPDNGKGLRDRLSQAISKLSLPVATQDIGKGAGR